MSEHAKKTVTLEHGIQIGDEICKECIVRELTAGDVLEATAESEQVVTTDAGPALVVSPTLSTLNTMARQTTVVSKGSEIPLLPAILRQLSQTDFLLLQDAAETLDNLPLEVGRRGRSGAVSAGN